MCALFGSPDRKMFQELAKLNSYRGNHSYSVATIKDNNVGIAAKGLGEFKMPRVFADYYIGHTQAPTTDAKSINSVHPSEIDGTLLWHNGIIKDHQVKAWQKELNSNEVWDTKLLHSFLDTQPSTDVLSKADGSFACVWDNGMQIYLFRNANSPLFTDGTSYSSTKFAGSEEIEAEVFYILDDKNITKTDITFKTQNNFYWSPD